jgi:lysozyme
MNAALLKATLKQAEGVKLKPYTDTVGKLSIGVGRNLADNGLRMGEVEQMLENDVTDVVLQVGTLPCWNALSDVRQRVLAEMCFQLGFGGLKAFKKMFAAIDEGNFAQAAAEMLDSHWASQTSSRAYRLSQMMRTNQDQV